jgi:murein DD-endopeptidase MepM/ murein hydrolase activator NlpD
VLRACWWKIWNSSENEGILRKVLTGGPKVWYLRNLGKAIRGVESMPVKEPIVEKDYIDILLFGSKSAPSRHLRISRKTLRITLCLAGFLALTFAFFVCDYIQIRKRAFELSRFEKESRARKSQVDFFSARIEDLEKQLSRLKDLDRRIRIIANIEKGQESVPFVGMGGPSPSDDREKMKTEKDDRRLVQQMKNDVGKLRAEAASREESLVEIEKLLEGKKEMIAHTPSVWPVPGWVTSGFGFRTNPFTGLNQMHEGLDISNRTGTPVTAPADGLVTDIGNDAAHGRIMVVSHGFGLTSRYSHLDRALVKVGQKVKRGEKIAEVGTSGKTTGPHLHYEVRLNGIPVNPMKYILN